jgi:hypothetical protein
MTFYFAWVDSTETTFGVEHKVEDESVFSIQIIHSEGDFPSALIDVKNPKVGLLNAGRKQWAWLSWDDGGTSGTTPLFFGRLVGIPSQLTNEIVQLTFVARPLDWDAQKQALADTLKVAPYWDPIWLQPEQRDEPDSVLEARSALWHIDRTSHVVTISDIISGEDGVIDLGGNYFYDSLDVSYGQVPGRQIQCEAEVHWQQAAIGSHDLRAELLAAFKAAGARDGVVQSYTGEGLARDWPEKGDGIGGKWEHGESGIERVDGTAIPQDYQQTVLANGAIGSFPVWSLNPTLNVDYDVVRSRSEKVTFTLELDTQALVADPGDAAYLSVNMSSYAIGEPVDPADSDNPDGVLPIGDVRRRAYFTTDRGRVSLEYLIAVCRAELLIRARAVVIKIQADWSSGLGLSCRKNVKIDDVRLPGGTATGKITDYSLVADGETGELRTDITIGCTIGQGNTVSAADGAPDYVAVDYVEVGYQTYTGNLVMPIAGEVTYEDFSNVAQNDDGVDFLSLTNSDILVRMDVINGPAVQRSVLIAGWDDLIAAVNAVNAVYTEVEIELTPFAVGPFHTDYPVTVSDLMAPKTINLESA